jgi:hypothetical protein
MLRRLKRGLHVNYVVGFTIKNANSAHIFATDTKVSAFKKTRGTCAGNAGKHFLKLRS